MVVGCGSGLCFRELTVRTIYFVLLFLVLRVFGFSILLQTWCAGARACECTSTRFPIYYESRLLLYFFVNIYGICAELHKLRKVNDILHSLKRTLFERIINTLAELMSCLRVCDGVDVWFVNSIITIFTRTTMRIDFTCCNCELFINGLYYSLLST